MICALRIKKSGTKNHETVFQWEFSVGPSEGVECGDHLWMGRYLLYRVAEEYGIRVSFDPKPVEGDWQGPGAHCNFSTVEMREKGGMQ